MNASLYAIQRKFSCNHSDRHMKIAILGNQARAISNFWSVLIQELTSQGHEILCLVPTPEQPEEQEWEAKLLALGVRLVRYPLDRKGLNPLRDMKTLFFLRRMFKRERPDVLFASTIKPVIYGSFAASLAGVPAKKHRHLMITGLGYMFEADSPVKKLLMRVACLMYKAAFCCASTVFFQNNDDRTLFAEHHIIPKSIAVRMCRGTGVDLARFTPAPLPEGPPVFLFVGRLLEAKGLRELHEAAKILRAKHPEAKVCILGPAEHGRGSVPLQEVEAWAAEGSIEYLGSTQDVRPYLAKATVVVLPSWREGVPCSLMEAMATGRGLIAADAPGSREVVKEGVNGFLVPVKDATALANAMEQFIMEPQLAATFGSQSRQLAEAELDAVLVARGIIKDMKL